MTLVAGQGCRHEGCDGGWAPSVSWERAFEEAWPAVERHLRQILRARNVPANDHEDYLQEVAARALAAHVAFHCAADLTPWASTVLRRLHIGAMRSGARQQRAARLVRNRHTPDTASAVVAKLDLDRVAETLATWSAADRDMVLGGRGAGLAPAASDGVEGSGAMYARRHRLRSKLLSAIDGVAGVFGVVRRFRYAHSPQLGEVASAMLTPAAIACVALIMPAGSALHDGDSMRSNADRPRAVHHAVSPASSRAAAPPGAITGGDAARTQGSDAGRAAGVATAASGPRPSYRQVHSPVEERVEVDTAGDSDPYVEVDNTDDEAGYYCFWFDGVVTETCVDQPGGAVVSPVPLPV